MAMIPQHAKATAAKAKATAAEDPNRSYIYNKKLIFRFIVELMHLDNIIDISNSKKNLKIFFFLKCKTRGSISKNIFRCVFNTK
jgi:ADP-heptose:LPS heptosyltransferase